MLKNCPECNAPVTDKIQCKNCLLLFAKREELILLRKRIKAERALGFDNEYIGAIVRDSQKIRRNALPVIAFMAFICNKIYFTSFILTYFKVWIHELGHATMAWVSGVPALPMSFWGFGLTFSSDNKSIFVFLCFNFILFILVRQSKRHKTPMLMWISFIFSILSLICTWLVQGTKFRELIIWGGFGGEIFLPPLMIISFYYRFPDKYLWDLALRWFVSFIGFYTLIQSNITWLTVYKTKSFEILGLNATDEIGDINRLVMEFDWVLNRLTTLYLSFSGIAWAVILGFYLYFAFIHKDKAIRDP